MHAVLANQTGQGEDPVQKFQSPGQGQLQENKQAGRKAQHFPGAQADLFDAEFVPHGRRFEGKRDCQRTGQRQQKQRNNGCGQQNTHSRRNKCSDWRQLDSLKGL